MFGGMHTTAIAIDSLESYQQVVAENLSHLNTPGYRRQIVSFETLLARGQVSPDELRQQGTWSTEVTHDFTPGIIQQTGRQLDVALPGDGFFELESPNGPHYTRNGAFFIGQDNALVTSNGSPVVGEGGSIRLPPNTTPDQITINEDGAIRVADNEVARLKIVAFEQQSDLVPVGTVTFKAEADAERTETTGRVRQGFRELSNVSATHELVKLIAGVRLHDAAQRALRSMSETLQQHTQT